MILYTWKLWLDCLPLNRLVEVLNRLNRQLDAEKTQGFVQSLEMNPAKNS